MGLCRNLTKSFLLADLLVRDCLGVELKGKKAIELGSGLGLTAMAAAEIFSEVVATDTEEVTQITKENVEMNKIENVRVIPLEW